MKYLYFTEEENETKVVTFNTLNEAEKKLNGEVELLKKVVYELLSKAKKNRRKDNV